jgi:hypothetical protein
VPAVTAAETVTAPAVSTPTRQQQRQPADVTTAAAPVAVAPVAVAPVAAAAASLSPVKQKDVKVGSNVPERYSPLTTKVRDIVKSSDNGTVPMSLVRSFFATR